jgi:hypothetical protein
MKKLLFLLGLLFVFIMSGKTQILWPFGAADVVTVTVSDTIDISDDIYDNMTYIDLDTDTNMIVSATNLSTQLRRGAQIVFEATESGVDADTIEWGTGLTGADTPVPNGKTVFIWFFYNGTAFKKICEQQTD